MQSTTETFGPFPIYVPRQAQRILAELAAGSAIVGFPVESNPTLLHVFYEGNRYNSPDLARFADRVKHAAGRCRWQRLNLEQWRREHGDTPPPSEYGYISFPTTAQAIVPTELLAEVALYDDVLGIVTPKDVDGARTLHDWIGTDDPNELFATGLVFDERRLGLGGDNPE
jgi:hypothetical protein